MSEGSQKKGFLNRILSSINFLVSPDLNTEDRRSVPRCPCHHNLSFLRENGTPGEATLVDVSSRGLQIETETPLTVDAAVALNAPQDQEFENTIPLMVHVIWSQPGPNGGFRSGLAMPTELEDEASWLDDILDGLGYSYDGSQRRRHIRAEAAISGTLVLDEDAEDKPHNVSVLNLGMGGALIKTPETMEKNQQFHLTVGPFGDLPAVELKGTILRVIKKPEEGYTLHPSRFRPLEERDEKLLTEYILQLLGNTE